MGILSSEFALVISAISLSLSCFLIWAIIRLVKKQNDSVGRIVYLEKKQNILEKFVDNLKMQHAEEIFWLKASNYSKEKVVVVLVGDKARTVNVVNAVDIRLYCEITEGVHASAYLCKSNVLFELGDDQMSMNVESGIVVVWSRTDGPDAFLLPGYVLNRFSAPLSLFEGSDDIYYGRY